MNERAADIINEEIQWYQNLIYELKDSDNYTRISEYSETVAALRSVLKKIQSESTNPVNKPSELTK